MNIVRKTFQYGRDTITLETGRIARQATGAVLVTSGETTVLVTVVGNKSTEPKDFFPLTVHYQERTYATGRIPGGYFKREGKPSEKETLTSRLIDRPVRPLFPEGFSQEVQIVATVLSATKEVDPDIAALLGASAALAISGMPFMGPLGAARVGYIDDSYVLNPNYQELKKSRLDLVVAGTAGAVLMVESEAKELTEDQMLGAVLFGHIEMQVAVNAIKEFAAEVATPAWNWQATPAHTQLEQRIRELFGERISQAYNIAQKQERYSYLDGLRIEATQQLMGADAQSTLASSEDEIQDAFAKIEKQIVRERITSGERRIDGHDNRTVRPIRIETGVLPRVHGSALFTRGETQALVVATLGNERDAQSIDALEGERRESFLLHYNFPPFSVGETGPMMGPKRREIGHGRLARRGVQAILPEEKNFPYTLRVVSEITESNGSSSMATVCGTSLALMDAGVPVTAPVAGIAMGLVKEGERFVVLTDILGDEDHLGDMDFKVAGTANGITALQMDIKIDGITEEIMETALNQAREGRLHILSCMNDVLSAPKTISKNAPRVVSFSINPEKIRDVIGKGGSVIRSITEETGASIDISDEGVVKVMADSQEACESAQERILGIVAEAQVGEIYVGKVVRITDFGAFVNILPGKDGLVHISQIAEQRVENVNDYLQVGQEVKVKVMELDRQGRIKLTLKNIT